MALDFEYISHCGARVLADILDGPPPAEIARVKATVFGITQSPGFHNPGNGGLS